MSNWHMTRAWHKEQAQNFLAEATTVHERIMSGTVNRIVLQDKENEFSRLLFLADTHAAIASIPEEY